MRAFKHIYQQPFIFATGIAALIHSTWALGTLFSGHAPPVDWLSWEWYEWIVPALLISFALDVGQISTSAQIRDNGLTVARATTFVIFAIATYYLQWLYMAVHMPLLDISAGVTGIHTAVAENMRNWAIWLIPALLPISTVSYTFSGENKKHDHLAQHVEEILETIDLPENDHVPLPHIGYENLDHVALCDDCGWQSTPKDSETNASRALAMHRRSCEACNAPEVS